MSFIFSTGCTILFKFHGTGLQADTSYWSGTGYTKEACEANCASDVGCYGYLYNSNDLRCTKSAKTDYEDNEYCTTCTFSSKQCGTDCPSTYKDFGAYKTSEESYAYFDISISECKAQCSSDVRCLGLGYNSAISRCYLSEYNSPDSEEECPTCTFSRKECFASFDVTTTANPELHIVTSDTTSSDTVGITYGITESTGFSIQETGT
nr:uncharacterized protein LOC105317532 [Crassostrea gigas]